MGRRTTSLLARLILLFVLVVAPLWAFHLLVYNWAYDTTRRDTVSAAGTNLIYARQETETSVRQVASQLTFLLDETRVKDYLTFHDSMSRVEYYETVRDTERLAYFLQHSNPLIAHVAVNYPTLSRVITSEKKIRVLPASEIGGILSAFRAQGRLLYQGQEGLCVGVMLPIYDYEDGRPPYYYLEARLSTEQILSLLSAFDMGGSRLTGMLHHGSGALYMKGADAALTEALVAAFGDGAGGAAAESTELTLNGVRYLAIACDSGYLDSTFLQLVPADAIFAFPMRLQRFTLAFTLLILLTALVYCVLLTRTVHRPIRELTGAMSEATRGRFTTRLSGSRIREYDLLARGYNHMSDEIERLIRENYESTIRTQRSELKQLYSQINPHFLYNTFFLLRHSIVSGETGHAGRLAGYLGNYFKYMTDQSSDELPLSSEYDHAVTYLNIQLMRFDGFVTADVSPLPERFAALPVPRLTLQPLFENAVEHGVPTHRESALIRLRFHEEDGLLRILLDDSGDALTDGEIDSIARSLEHPAPEQEQHALVNTHRRLQIYYGSGCGLSVARSPLGGLRVVMTLRADPAPRKEDGQ